MIFLLALSGYFSWADAQQGPISGGRHITIKLSPLKNTKIFLGSNYGNTLALFDSAYLNEKSEGVFQGPAKLTGGIYFLVTKDPNYAIIQGWDFLMDDEQQFNILADTSTMESTTITGSKENALYAQYSRYSTSQNKRIEKLIKEFKDSTSKKTKKDTANAIKEEAKLRDGVKQYQDSICNKYPDALLSALFNTMKRPPIKEIPTINGKKDSTYPFRYYKEHYWDDVNFADDRILHTPFFEAKLDEYFKNLVSIEADSIIKEVNYILLFARTGKEIFPFLLNKFTKQYMNPQYMGQDKVFVFLFENFYAKGDTTLLDAGNKKIVTERAYNLMANQIGLPAVPMNFVDTAGRPAPLYGLKSKFTFIVFWDPTCGHCKIEIPRLDSMYRAKWKAMGVSIYAVNINELELKAWKNFIIDNKLTGWVHAHETAAIQRATEKANQMNFRQAYDAKFTPTYYLLDEDKHIIAKKLSLEQFDEIMKLKMKK